MAPLPYVAPARFSARSSFAAMPGERIVGAGLLLISLAAPNAYQRARGERGERRKNQGR
jgi:hypothetical protein